jgi:hypothetical protein
MIRESRYHPTDAAEIFARCVGPRIVGGIYHGGPWAGLYRVLGIHYGPDALAALGWDAGWAITVLGEDGRTRTHCTAWQTDHRHRTIAEPAKSGLVYRAAYQSDSASALITRGRYSALAPAREHIEHLLHREDPAALVVWLPDPADLDDPVAELEAHFLHRGGRTTPTGYLITPLEVHAAFEPHPF